MSTVVTLNVFSGRPNPAWVLSEAQERDLHERLDAIQTLTSQKPIGTAAKLGYRGFSVTRSSNTPLGALNLYINEGIVDKAQDEPALISENREFERWLLNTNGNLALEVRSHVESEIANASIRLPSFESSLATSGPCTPCVAKDAPIFTPGKWNIPTVQPYNNCYNYANDHITNTFAQPGRAHGLSITSLNCSAVQPNATADGLIASSSFSAPLPSGNGWYVASVIWPGNDYHWYRQDNPSCWSHKPGSTAARNTDNSGRIIADPQTCDRGPYTNFCTYMITKRGVVIQ